MDLVSMISASGPAVSELEGAAGLHTNRGQSMQ